MRVRTFWIGALGLMLAASITACGGKKDDLDEGPAGGGAATGAGGPKVDATTAGNVEGEVSFDGMAPKNEPIKMNADPVCVKENSTPQEQETYMVSNGKLANVFVYVKDGLGNYSYDPPAGPVEIDQKGCRYHPHVFGIRVGQELDIVNSDPTLHNIHALPKGNAEFNTGQQIQGMKTVHTFNAKEVMVPFKCDVHGWMNAFVGVLDHPYFAVTDANGAFKIDSLAPGTYKMMVWHEGMDHPIAQQVQVAANGTARVDLAIQVAR